MAVYEMNHESYIYNKSLAMQMNLFIMSQVNGFP